MKKVALALLALGLGFGAACSASDVAGLDSASACLKSVSADMDYTNAQSQGRSDTGVFAQKAAVAQAACNKAKAHELDVKAGAK